MMQVREIMSRPARTINAGESAQEAAEVMALYGVGALVVCDGERVVGVVTDRDLVVHCLAQRELPDHVPVRAVMTPDPLTIHSSVSIEEAAEILGAHGVHRLPVIAQDYPIGVVSSDDIARYCPDDGVLALMLRRLSSRVAPSARLGS